VIASGCWTGRSPSQTTPTPTPASITPAQPAQPAQTAEPAPKTLDTRDYRAVTLSLDAVGAATLATGLVLLHRGANEDMAGALIDAGAIIGGFGAITTHLLAGRTDRAWRSYLIRGGLVMASSLAGMAVGCGDRGMELGCTVEGMAWGMAAGIAIAAPIDAFMLQRPEGSWTPTVVPREGGATAGIGGTF
jgi:hypothetical protein